MIRGRTVLQLKELRLNHLVRQVAEGIDNHIWLVCIFAKILVASRSREHQDRFVLELSSSEDVGLHRIANDHGFIGREPEFFSCRSEHDWTWFSNAECFDS